MKTIKSFAILLVLFAGAGFSSIAATPVAEKTAPDTVVADLYKQHQKRSPFFQTRSRALLDKYFTRNLANLILKDAAGAKDEVGAIDGDPLFNAQDMEIKHFQIHKAVQRAGGTEVAVTFENFGQKKSINFVLVPASNEWKISNIKYDDGADLMGILQSHFAAARSTREVKVFLVALGDNGQSGKKIGCDDSLVPVTRNIRATRAPLKAALQELLSIPPEPVDHPPLQNFWKGRNLRLRSVSINKQTATIRISGAVFVAGICDEPRIVEQIEATARQFPSVKKVKVFIGRRTLADAIR